MVLQMEQTISMQRNEQHFFKVQNKHPVVLGRVVVFRISKMNPTLSLSSNFVNLLRRHCCWFQQLFLFQTVLLRCHV
jgi:hypothetical protein